MANIRLVTFSNEVVTPQNDGVIYKHTVAQDGMLTNGFLATIKNDTTVHLTWGLGMIAGREFEVQEQDITIPLSGGSATQGRLYFHMDLSNSSTPIDILFDTETTPLAYDENVNVTNGVCEVELCHFTVNGISISDIVQTFNTLPSGASSVAYNGTSSGLSATDVQGAIDEVAQKIKNIGDMQVKYSSPTLATSGTFQVTDTITVDRGVYIASGSIAFAANSTGRRVITVTTDSEPVIASVNRAVVIDNQGSAVAIGERTRVFVFDTDNHQIKLGGCQYSGGSLNCSTYLQVVKIA